jgi:type IV pilus assembly protein PilA
MKMNTRSTKGFTLVEIMIVVVIIGLLAAMAIPAFQKVRQNSIEKTLTNDARQLAGAANQIYLETGSSVIDVTADPNTGLVSGAVMSTYVHQLSKGNNFPAQLSAGSIFTGGNAALPSGSTIISFTPDGQKI